jgi:hypothetical protein
MLLWDFYSICKIEFYYLKVYFEDKDAYSKLEKKTQS